MSDLVLSDELLIFYLNFTRGKSNDSTLAKNFFSYYSGDYKTNYKQLKEIKETKKVAVFPDDLLSQVANSPDANKTLEELVKDTVYKVILHEKELDYPHININGDSVERNFNLTFKAQESRDKAIDLIRAHCAGATDITIYDTYIHKQKDWPVLKRLFQDVFPKKPLTIYNGTLKKQKETELQAVCSDWMIEHCKNNPYPEHHDRYILIDSSVEIILSSGIYYLFDATKEINIVIRQKKPTP